MEMIFVINITNEETNTLTTVNRHQWKVMGHKGKLMMHTLCNVLCQKASYRLKQSLTVKKQALSLDGCQVTLV